jgi:hypothetical protein
MISNWWHQALARKVTTFRRDQRDVQRHRFRPVLELLEDRRVMATITVTSAFDDGSITEDGQLTLREAIESINQASSVNADVTTNGDAFGTKDTILFNITGVSADTITLTGSGLDVFKTVTIDGANAGTGKHIILTGNNVLNDDGLTLGFNDFSASGSVIRGLVINGFNGNGIVIQSPVSKVLIEGNFIGTDKTGATSNGNTGNGILIQGSDNTIGGTGGVGLGAGLGNLISGNGVHGVSIEGTAASGNRLHGNRIGTDVTGQLARGNGGDGVSIRDAGSNTIGGSAVGEGNLISGNKGAGIEIATGSHFNFVLGNRIGTNAAGTNALGNTLSGISIHSDSTLNSIGGDSTFDANTGLSGAGNLISGNGGSGVLINGLSSSSVGDGMTINLQGNFIGTDFKGTTALGNAENGVSVVNSFKILIGGDSKVDDGGGKFLGNLISGNVQDGILIQGTSATGNLVQGNFIGLQVNGSSRRANGRHGVYLYEGASSNTIGGDTAAQGNVISGNAKDGILIKALGGPGNFPIPTQFNLVQNNFIGTDSTGTQNRGNQGNGVTITNGIFSSTDGDGADFNTIGGSLGEGNIIAFNKGTGVLVGVSPDDDVVNNSILANSILANGKLGIDLGGDGPNDPNDTGDGDDGPNFFQNFPTLDRVEVDGDDLIIFFSISDFAFIIGAYRIEFFASNVPDPSGFGEGQLFLGSVVLPGTTMPQEFKVTNGASLSFRFFTATATFLQIVDDGEDLPRSTSEFSNVVFIPIIPPVLVTPGGDPIVVDILEGDPPPEVLPIVEVVFQEFTVSNLPPPPTLQQVKVLAPLVRDVFENLVDAPGEIHGQILDDPNALGKVGPDTYPLHGQPVYLDFNRNGEYDDGEPITVTNTKGEYTFTSLTPGQYTVHLVLGRSQDVTFAPKQDNKIELRSGNMIVTNVNFGVRFRARRRPASRTALPWNVDGVLLADAAAAPSLPVAMEYGVDSLPLWQSQPAPPLPAEEPTAAEDDGPASGLFRWCGWLLGAALLAPWQQLANRRQATEREQRAQ